MHPNPLLLSHLHFVRLHHCCPRPRVSVPRCPWALPTRASTRVGPRRPSGRPPARPSRCRPLPSPPRASGSAASGAAHVPPARAGPGAHACPPPAVRVPRAPAGRRGPLPSPTRASGSFLKRGGRRQRSVGRGADARPLGGRQGARQLASAPTRPGGRRSAVWLGKCPAVPGCPAHTRSSVRGQPWPLRSARGPPRRRVASLPPPPPRPSAAPPRRRRAPRRRPAWVWASATQKLVAGGGGCRSGEQFLPSSCLNRNAYLVPAWRDVPIGVLVLASFLQAETRYLFQTHFFRFAASLLPG